MPEPTEPSGPTDPINPTGPAQASAASADQAASVRRVIAEAARSGPIHAGRLVPVTLARAALAEAAGLLPRRPATATATATPAQPADPHHLPGRGTADEHHHDHDQ